MRLRGSSLVVAILAAASGVAGCETGDRPDNGDVTISVSGGTTTTGGDAGPPDAGGPELEIPKVDPPPGWHLWAYPPQDCAVFIPDDVSTVEPPEWKPCPFMPDGCTEAGAPWAQELGWGYGSLLSVGLDGGRVYVTLGRRVISKGWWEHLLLRDNQVIGAWRYNTDWETGSLCGAMGPRLDSAGHAWIGVVRQQFEEAPYVFAGRADTLMEAPDRTEIFAPPDSGLIPGGKILMSSRLLTFETYYGRFAVRDLLTGDTYRPDPPDQPHNELGGAVPVNDSVFYEPWTGIYSSIWVTTDNVSVPLLRSDTASHNQFVTDGTDAAWQRGVGYVDTNLFQTVELWTSPLATGPANLAPRKLVTLPITVFEPPSTGISGLSIGEGWIAVWLGIQDVRLYRISDGLERRLPVVSTLRYSGTDMYDGMVIAGGALWMKTSIIPQAGNNIRFIHRFEIGKLPAP